LSVENKERPVSVQPVNFKACPRCRGDVHARQDMYGDYQECLQCGYMRDLQLQYQGPKPHTKSDTKQTAA